MAEVLSGGESEPLVPGSWPEARNQLYSMPGRSSERRATLNPFVFPRRQVGCCGRGCVGRRSSVEMARGLSGGRPRDRQRARSAPPSRSDPLPLLLDGKRRVPACGGDGPTSDERGE
jgi:hypothetical protein